MPRICSLLTLRFLSGKVSEKFSILRFGGRYDLCIGADETEMGEAAENGYAVVVKDG
jgi:hypothetical protein